MSSDSIPKAKGQKPERATAEPVRELSNNAAKRKPRPNRGAQDLPTVEEGDTLPRVLVVDDSPTFRGAIRRMLEAEGYRIVTASSGEEAFEICINTSFAAVVSDITMGALSGVQLCRLLRSDPTTKDMPVVLLTAADDRRSRFWGRNAGAAAYVAKERARDELVPEVKRVLNRSATSMIPVRRRARRRASPMERLSQVMDELLFRAVISSEVQRLMHHTGDRQQFARELASLASDVADYSYLVVRLGSPDGDTYTVHARGPWPKETDDSVLQTLGIPVNPEPNVDVVRLGATLPTGSAISLKDQAHCPIDAAGESLGDIRAFGASFKRLGGEDRMTIDLISQQAGLLVKNMCLLEETRRLANSDALTGLHNRRRCTERLETELGRARRYAVPLSIALVDVDHFKAVNDNFGHNIGDDVLKCVAAALSDAVRQVDLVARWGGEEFLALLPDTDSEGAMVVAQRMRAAVESLQPFREGPDCVHCSVGIATFAGEPTGTLFVDRADTALYQAKENGRNRVEVADAPGTQPPGGPEAAGETVSDTADPANAPGAPEAKTDTDAPQDT